MTILTKGYPSTRLWSPYSITKIRYLVFKLPTATSTSLYNLRKGWLWPVWDINSKQEPYFITNQASSITSFVITLISALVSNNIRTFEPSSSCNFVLGEPIEYHVWFIIAFWSSSTSKLLTRNLMALSSEIALVSYFSTVVTKARNLPTVKLTPRSKICLVIIVALTDSFKTPTTLEYF